MSGQKWYTTRGFVYVVFFAIVALAFTNAFWGLTNGGGVYDWDEARHGVNAFEMINNHNYILHTYDGQVDYWNVKPPMSMWVIALAYRIFGYNVFALRFFSALCLPLSVTAILWFMNRFVGKTAAVGSGLLLAVTGTRFHHLFKTGDPDALFFLFCLLCCIFLYMAVKQDYRFSIGCGLCIAFAFLTKALHIAPLLLVIAGSLWMTRKQCAGKWKKIIFLGIISALVPILIWAILRFSYDGTAFFQQMILLDVLNRVGTVVENHAGNPFYYFIVLKNLMGGWVFWGILLLFLMSAFILLTSSKNPPSDPVFLCIFVGMLVWPLIVFSLSKTKLGWYIYPSLIGLYLLAGYFLQKLVEICADKKRRKAAQVILGVVSAIMGIGLVIIPEKNIHQLASTSSAESVFASMQSTHKYENHGYYAMDTAGNEIEVAQSWILHALYQGLYHKHGDIHQYLADEENNLLLVHYFDDEDLTEFLALYGDFSTVVAAENYIVLN